MSFFFSMFCFMSWGCAQDLNHKSTSTNFENPNVIFFTLDSTLPKQLHVKGEVVDVSTGFSCGILNGSGTLKIKLTESTKEYPFEYVYLVVPCFSGGKKFIGKEVVLKVNALYESNKDCYRPIVNNINSGEIPFYWLKIQDREALYN